MYRLLNKEPFRPFGGRFARCPKGNSRAGRNICPEGVGARCPFGASFQTKKPEGAPKGQRMHFSVPPKGPFRQKSPPSGNICPKGLCKMPFAFRQRSAIYALRAESRQYMPKGLKGYNNTFLSALWAYIAAPLFLPIYALRVGASHFSVPRVPQRGSRRGG